MKKVAISIILSAAMLFSLGAASKKVRLHTLGDSTMEQQNPNVKDQRGWVQLLQSFFNEDLQVVDPAKSGTSTKSYYKGIYCEKAKKAIQPGDYVIIQFGHNDEKHGGKDGPIGTAPTDSFRIYLRKYVNEVRALGANPILVTPVVRNMFGRDDKLTRRAKHDLGEAVHQKDDPSFDLNDTTTFNYPYNMKYVAKELNCPLIDMTAPTARLVDSLGYSAAKKLIYNVGDGTHFGTSGALLFSQLFVKELQRRKMLTEYLIPTKKLITNPSAINFANLFPGTDAVQAFDVCYLGKNAKKGGKISLSVSEGFTLSTRADSAFSKGIELACNSANGLNVLKVYVKTTPAKAGNFTGSIKITDNAETNTIALSGNCQEMKDNQPASVSYMLTASAAPNTKGAVSALPEVWSGMELIGYNIPTLSNGTPDATLANKKVQQNTIQGGAWPKNEIDVVYTRYIQFGVKTSELSELFVKSIDFYAGGGSNFRVVTSLTEDFGNPSTVGEAANVKGDEMIKYSFNINQQVSPGKTLFVRIYPWGNKSIKDQYLNLYGLNIEGMGGKPTK